MFTVLIFLAVLSVLVLAHEYGHFITAVKSGIKVEEFGIGFPPRLIAWYKKNNKWKIVFGNKEITDADSTIYSINLIPLGGFNKIKGENADVDWRKIKYALDEFKVYLDKADLDNKKLKKLVKELDEQANEIELIEETFDLAHYKKLDLQAKYDYLINFVEKELKENVDAFYMQKAWKRLLVLFAGPFMNFILAIVLLAIGFYIGLPEIINDNDNSVANAQIQIYEVADNSPAKEAGLALGDFILKVDGKEFKTVASISDYMKNKEGQEVHLLVKSGAEEKEVVVVPKKIEALGQEYVGIGISLVKIAVVDYPWYEAIWLAIKHTFATIWLMLVTIVMIFKNLFTSGHAGVALAGPVGIAQLTSKFAGMGFNYLLQFTAMFSINLGVINLFPFPALDGGRILFILWEMIKGKPVNQKVEAWAHTVGFVILILLVLIVSVKEVSNMF